MVFTHYTAHNHGSFEVLGFDHSVIMTSFFVASNSQSHTMSFSSATFDGDSSHHVLDIDNITSYSNISNMVENMLVLGAYQQTPENGIIIKPLPVLYYIIPK